MGTKGLELVHANEYDEHWGIGVGLNSKDVLTKSFQGTNMLGKILMEIRDSGNVIPVSNPNPTCFVSLVEG